MTSDAGTAALAHAEALVGHQRFQEAVTWLSTQVRSASAAQDRLALAHRLILLLRQLGHPRRAWLVLEQVRQWTGEAPPPWLAQLAFGLSPAWEQALQGPTLRLRRLVGGDAASLKAWFADARFSASVNREYGAQVNKLSLAQVAAQLDAQSRQIPADTGAHVLLIEHCAVGDPLGLASLVNIDALSRRAEFIIGFAKPDHTPATHVAEAGALALEMAFVRLEFHRVTAVVYGDNPRLSCLADSLRGIGFAHEGVQREHLWMQDAIGHSGSHVDLHLFGGLRAEVLAQPLTRRLMKRYPAMG